MNLIRKIARLKESKDFKNGFVYILGEILNKAIPFLILPVLSDYLSPAEYGIVSNYVVTITLFLIIITLSSSSYISVMFYKVSSKELSSIVSNVLGLFLVMSILALPLIFFVSDTLGDILKVDYKWLYALVALSFSMAVNEVYTSLLRLKEKALSFIIFKITQLAINLSISLVLIVTYDYGWEGRLYGIGVAYILFALASLFLIKKEFQGFFSIKKTQLRKILKFGLPLIPHSLQIWLRTGLDRYLLGIILGTSVVGIYAIGFQISSVVVIITAAGAKFLGPFLMKKMSALGTNSTVNEQQLKIQITKTILLFSVMYLAIGVVSIIAGVYFIPYFLNVRYVESIEVIYWIIPAFIFEGIYTIFNIQLVYYKKTFLLSRITVIGAVFHIILLFVLINHNGLIGAAQAYLISVTYILFTVIYFSDKVLTLPWKTALNSLYEGISK